MKKAFIMLGQWVLKHRKKLIYGALALFVVQFCFFNLGGIGIGGNNEVFAVLDTPDQNANFQEQATEWYGTMAFAQKLVYVLIYPVLIVAGKLVDNSLVYGEVFGFDAILWKLRVIVRNLANFGLGFIFIYKIFEILIKGKEGEGIKKLLISSLIAGVGIQASWFIMAALIDMSTILTYGLGGLPISVLGGDESKTGDGNNTGKDEGYDPYVLKTIVSVDAKDIDTIHTYLTNTDKNVDGEDISESNRFYISECETMVYSYTGSVNTGTQYSEELIIVPKMVYYRDSKGNYKLTEQAVCSYYGQVYLFSSSSLGLEVFGIGWENPWGDAVSFIDNQSLHEGEIANRKLEINSGGMEFIRSEIEKGNILLPGNAHTTGGIVSNIWTGRYSSNDLGLDVDNQRIAQRGGSNNTSKLHNLIDGDSYVGVFTALYSSLLNAGRNVIVNDGSVYASLLNTALSFCHMLAIAIPLIVVALVFMMRIGVLRLAIALSPVIVLLKAFGFDKSDFMKDGIFNYLKVETLLPIIFYPAIVCFAVSLSTVLVRKISDLNWEKIDTLKGTEILGGLIKLNIEGFSIGVGKLVVAVMGIAITWFLVRTAVEASKLGKSGIVKNLKGLANDAILSAKLIPIPGKDGKSTMVGLGTAFGLDTDRDGNIVSGDGILSKMRSKVKSEFTANDDEAVRQMFMTDEEKTKEAQKKKDTAMGRYKDVILGYSTGNVPDNWTEAPVNVGSDRNKVNRTWNNLELSVQEKIIEGINNLEDKALRGEYGKTLEVEMKNGKKYKFDGEKYVLQS